MYKDVNDELYVLEIKKWVGVVMFVIDFLGDLDVNCFVFFCLIFNIVEFLMMIGVIGFFMVFMVVLVWCLV